MAHPNARLTPVTRCELVASRSRPAGPRPRSRVSSESRERRSASGYGATPARGAPDSRTAPPRRITIRTKLPRRLVRRISLAAAPARDSGRTASPGRSSCAAVQRLRGVATGRSEPAEPAAPCHPRAGASLRARPAPRRPVAHRREEAGPHPAWRRQALRSGASPRRRADRTHGRSCGIDYLHVAVDDHSRYAYVEALPDERGITCAAFLARAASHFGEHGVQRPSRADRQREGIHLRCVHRELRPNGGSSFT